MKSFRVNPLWLYYAHGPGADDGQPLATQLVDLIDGDKPVEVTDPALVAEIIDVAGLYVSDSNVQDDDRLWFRAYPGAVIKRGEAWLAARSAS